jgi:hypothetical protein
MKDERDGDVFRAAHLPHLWGYSDPSLCLGAEPGRNHSEAYAGCIVSLTTPIRMPLSAFRSVSFRSVVENVSSVLRESYLLR